MSPKRKTMIFLASQAVTLFGSTLVQMAIVWYVTLNTGEGAWIAAFTVASSLDHDRVRCCPYIACNVLAHEKESIV